MDTSDRVSEVWESYWARIKLAAKRVKTPYSEYLWDTHIRVFEECVFKNTDPLHLVLEVGVGEGQLLKRIARLGMRTVGVDISESAIGISLSELHEQEELLCVGDALSLSFGDNTFDFVYSLGLIEHFERDELKFRIVEELVRVVKPSGLVFISVPKKWSVYTPKKIVNKMTGTWRFGYEEEFSAKELIRLVGSYLDGPRIGGIDIYPSVLNLIPGIRPKRYLDAYIVVPIITWLEQFSTLTRRIGHMLFIVGRPCKP